MKLKLILTALAVAILAFAQPALAQFTQNEKGEVTHYKGIELPPIQTVEEAKAQAKKEIAAAKKAREAEQAASNIVNRKSSIVDIFFTGKPYLEETGQYLFLFRHYDPELGRWTTADPSGFPDGANNVAYIPIPTKEIDWLGLAVKAIYSITKRTLTIDGINFSGLNSGDNVYENRNSIGGPIPTGSYRIFSRDQDNMSYAGHHAFILDPVDGLFNARNDYWDNGDSQGRWGFRIHADVGTTGCIAAGSIDDISALLWGTNPTLRQDIVQHSNIPGAITWPQEYFFGSLKVIE